MNDWLILALIAYVIITLIWCSTAISAWNDEYDLLDRKFFARMALLSPIWPLALVTMFAILASQLIIDATRKVSRD